MECVHTEDIQTDTGFATGCQYLDRHNKLWVGAWFDESVSANLVRNDDLLAVDIEELLWRYAAASRVVPDDKPRVKNCYLGIITQLIWMVRKETNVLLTYPVTRPEDQYRYSRDNDDAVKDIGSHRLHDAASRLRTAVSDAAEAIQEASTIPNFRVSFLDLLAHEVKPSREIVPKYQE